MRWRLGLAMAVAVLYTTQAAPPASTAPREGSSTQIKPDNIEKAYQAGYASGHAAQEVAKAKADKAAEGARKNAEKQALTIARKAATATAAKGGEEQASKQEASSGLPRRQHVAFKAVQKAFGHCSKGQSPYSILLTNVQAWKLVRGKPLECPAGKYRPTEMYYQVSGCGTSGSTFVAQIDCVCTARCCVTDGKVTLFTSKFDAVATTEGTKSAYIKTMQTAYEAYLEHRNDLTKMMRLYQKCGHTGQSEETMVRSKGKSKGKGKGKKHVGESPTFDTVWPTSKVTATSSTTKATAGRYTQTDGHCTEGPHWQSPPRRGEFITNHGCLYFDQLRSRHFPLNTQASCAKFCDEQIGCGAYSWSEHNECCVYNSSHHKGDGTPGAHCNVKGGWANRVEDHSQWSSTGADILLGANGTEVGGYYAERFITLLEESFNRLQTYARSQPHPSVILSHTDPHPVCRFGGVASLGQNSRSSYTPPAKIYGSAGTGKVNCCQDNCGPGTLYKAYPVLWDKLAVYPPKGRGCPVPKLVPAGAHIVRIVPCGTETDNVGVFCALVKVVKGKNPLVQGWTIITPSGQTSEEKASVQRSLDFRCDQLKKCTLEDDLKFVLAKLSQVVAESADQSIRNAITSLRFEAAQQSFGRCVCVGGKPAQDSDCSKGAVVMQQCTSCHAGRRLVELSNGEKLCKPNVCTCDFSPTHEYISKGQARVAAYAASIGSALLCPTNNRSIGDVCPASMLAQQDQDYTKMLGAPPPPPALPLPPVPPGKECTACSVAECTFGKLCGPVYVCSAGAAKRGCHKESRYWPRPHSGCDKCCNAANC